MNDGQDTQLARLRLVDLICRLTLLGFIGLLVWQLIVLATGGYPEHIQPAVKFFSGSAEVVPMAYVWTIRLAIITIAGVFGSLIGCCTVHQYIRKKKANKAQMATPMKLSD
jgi:hypothetical protein